MELAFEHITADRINIYPEKNIEVSVLRLDKIHPVISGNKWFKLRYYLQEAKALGKKRIVTFGGAWSNHIAATAAACRMCGFLSAAIIRGERPASFSNTLLQALEYGMQLHFISRTDYKLEKWPDIISTDEDYIINQGGYGEKGAAGASGILDHAGKDFTHCCCAVGTGTMMAGLLRRVQPGQKVTGISVMKNNDELAENIRGLSGDKSSFPEVIHDYHFGGYARYQPALISFMNDFYRQTNIPSDFVYTGKLFFAVNDLVQNSFFSAGSRLLLIHSGGLQGNVSLQKGTLIF